jgi:Domain of unknown function (DU1801)
MPYGLPKFRSMGEFWDFLPEDEREIVDVLREIVLENLPPYCVERFSYNVPCYYGKRRICMIWPASVPRGGIKTGVLLGFSQGYRLADVDRYLTHGTNKVIFYKIYRAIDQIDERAIVKLLHEAAILDAGF